MPNPLLNHNLQYIDSYNHVFLDSVIFYEVQEKRYVVLGIFS